MSRYKQIEEMANDLAKICPELVENCCGQVNCVTHLTLSLSNLGYRKSSDVAMEIFEDVIEILNDEYVRCNKWEAHTILTITQKIADLKKKYESEGAE